MACLLFVLSWTLIVGSINITIHLQSSRIDEFDNEYSNCNLPGDALRSGDESGSFGLSYDEMVYPLNDIMQSNNKYFVGTHFNAHARSIDDEHDAKDESNNSIYLKYIYYLNIIFDEKYGYTRIITTCCFCNSFSSIMNEHYHLVKYYHVPFCCQPLYYTSEQYIFNLTLLNPFSEIGEIANTPQFEITSIVLENGQEILRADIAQNTEKYNYISIEFAYNNKLWPWCGWLGIYKPQTEHITTAIEALSGIIKVDIHMINTSANREGNSQDNKCELHTLAIPYSLKIMARPPARQGILWDQFHNLQLGYLPRDDLERDNDMLDWFGHHLHTNYHTLYDFIKDKGYFIEILRTDYSCIDAELYSALIIVDNKDIFDANELKKLQFDILNNELSVIIFADCYNEMLMNDVRFFDENTRLLWDALTGGANTVALNELLDPFGIQFGDMVSVGEIQISDNKYSTYFQTGSIVMQSPVHSYVLISQLLQLQSAKRSKNKKDNTKYKAIPLAMYGTSYMNKGSNPGRISVFGDSTCLDPNQHKKNCFWLMEMLLKYSCVNELDDDLVQITHDNTSNIMYLMRNIYLVIIQNHSKHMLI